jgi:transposase InsO family protein
MCKCLKVPRSTFYYKPKPTCADTDFENAVIDEFRRSRNNYGTRKLKIMLKRRGFSASRRRIGNTMKKYNLVSNYTLKLTKRHKIKVNNDETANVANREFSDRPPLDVVVSDLTYVKVAGKWNYICLLLDLHNRKILGSAVAKNKTPEIVKKAFYGVQNDLRKIRLFHTDRGSEFKNYVVEEILKAFGIGRSLSAKGSPTDNAVAEAMYSIIKAEFAFKREFVSIDELELLWFDYVNWYNNVRIHGTLDYATPAEFVPKPIPD